MVITIDGPAGAGKSSAARGLATRLAFRFLDTGAMYRAVAFAAMQRGVPWNDSERLAELTGQLQIDVTESHVLLNGKDVTEPIRAMAVTRVIHHVADNPAIRAQLVKLQRDTATGGHYVTEGRDQGTIVFPDAACKFFMTASPEERARRRLQDLRRRGDAMPFEDVLRQQNDRDQRDRQREVGGLIAAEDAVQVNTDSMTLEEVVDQLESIARDRCGLDSATPPHA